MTTKDELLERLNALEQRVADLEDERRIREVLARYGYNADACRDEAYVQLFTEDGVVDLTIGDQSMYEGVVRWEGHDGIRQFISDPTAHHREGFYGHAMHVMGNNVVVHLHGDEAVVNSYNLTLHGKGEAVELIAAGNNQWILRREDGQWRIRERRRRHVGGPGYIDNLDATAS